MCLGLPLVSVCVSWNEMCVVVYCGMNTLLGKDRKGTRQCKQWQISGLQNVINRMDPISISSDAALLHCYSLFPMWLLYMQVSG